MAGIYLHIPFCHQACYYCDFHFSTLLKHKQALVDSLVKEIDLRKNYFLPQQQISTIYFGGGTPSVLDELELKLIFEALHRNFNLSKVLEITFEVNPEDVNVENLVLWKSFGINRLSFGIQSFNNDILNFLNRKHSREQAINAVELAKKRGFDNFSIDIIYGIPGLSMEIFEEQLQLLVSLDVPHVSAYCLTIEPKTVFGNQLKKGQFKPIEDEEAEQQYFFMLEFLAKNGIEQYEISNFSKHDYYSKHNSSYWKQESYLGIGPSAHSYNGEERSWNVSNNTVYINSVSKEILPLEREYLSKIQKVNEYILTGLRTIWGIDLKQIERQVSKEQFVFFIDQVEKFKNQLLVNVHTNILRLTKEGTWMADGIASDLFFEEEEIS